MNNSFDILRDLDSAISLEPEGSLDWVITKLSMNCLSVEILSKSKKPERDYGKQVADGYLQGIKILKKEKITPPYFSHSSLQSLRKIARTLGTNGADVFEISEPEKGDFAEMDREIGNTSFQLMGRKYKSHGAIEGTLEMISIHNRPRFNIYHNLFLKAVSCTLPVHLREKVAQSLGRRVIASGMVSYNFKDEPITVELEELEIIAQEHELPTIEQFVGSDPDFTGDMTTEEYIRSIRNG
jgi:hypothetical protein